MYATPIIIIILLWSKQLQSLSKRNDPNPDGIASLATDSYAWTEPLPSKHYLRFSFHYFLFN